MLAQFYPPIIGGEENHVRNLSRALVKRGHDVSVATFWHTGMTEYDEDNGLRIFRIRGTAQRGSALYLHGERRHAPPLPDPEAVLALRRLIKQEKPDIVHAHNWIVHSFVPLKRWSRAGLVMTMHSYEFVCAIHNLIRNGDLCDGPGLSKCLQCAGQHYGTLKGGVTTIANNLHSIPQGRAVDMFMPVSRAVAMGTSLDKKRLPYQIIPNFIADDADIVTDNTFAELDNLPQTPYLLFVGDLSRLKGIEVLLKAYSTLQQDKAITNLPPLVLIGREVPETPKTLPPNVLLFKSWPHEAVMHAWKRSLVGIAPSIWADPCPTVVLEAMVMGSPVVASRIGGMVDMVDDGETGFLFPPGDADALAAALRRLLIEPGLRQQMGEASKQKVVAFQAKTVVPRIEAVYRQVRPESVSLSASAENKLTL